MAESKIIITKDLMDKVVEELTEYRAIGTVEELQSMKEKNDTLRALYEDARKEGNHLIAKERAAAIDEFAEQMQEKVESFQAEINGIRADLLTLDYFSEFVFEIAEQMKEV